MKKKPRSFIARFISHPAVISTFISVIFTSSTMIYVNNSQIKHYLFEFHNADYERRQAKFEKIITDMGELEKNLSQRKALCSNYSKQKEKMMSNIHEEFIENQYKLASDISNYLATDEFNTLKDMTVPIYEIQNYFSKNDSSFEKCTKESSDIFSIDKMYDKRKNAILAIFKDAERLRKERDNTIIK